MGKSSVEKLFSRLTGRDVKAGDFVWAAPDLIYVHDVLGPMMLSSYGKLGNPRVRFSGKVIFVYDHIFPPKDAASANNILNMVEFADENQVENIPMGEGIEHTLLIEKNIIRPGMFVVGSDSHTVTAGANGAFGAGLGSTDLACLLATGTTWFMVPETMKIDLTGNLPRFSTGKDVILNIISKIGVDGANYMSMEFHTSGETHISLDDRLAIANMTVEAGAKTCLLPPDEKTDLYNAILWDEDAGYSSGLSFNLSEIRPSVAVPFSPGNVKDVKEVVGTKVDQVYLGNCANGTFSDLKEAAEIFRRNPVHDGVTAIVVPATREIYRKALDAGLIRIFIDAGCTVSPPTCGACAGLHMGVLARDQVCISNTNRNFRGRMGDPRSKVYLANSYVTAAAAVEGKIVDPTEVF
ncbi:MAG: aconitase/3-isopropylmalate dehydratase large subunit family protein [Candidatus Thermoplasmatota archaeon]|nr:aconitase/3-isopropylmalate dehydratase large subunit family protein [Candidatus Thermoplasmatota archaeon]